MAARFFVPRENFHDRSCVIAGQELAHLRRVLRLAAGDRITIFDDAGREHEAIIRALSAERGEAEIIRSYDADKESRLRLTLALGLTKGDKMDFVVEKATELGVQAIMPFASAFAVPKLDEQKIVKRTERWRKIAMSAAKQCGRTQVPEILPLREFQRLSEGAAPDLLKLFFWEKETTQSLRQVHDEYPDSAAVLVAIGPEGGFSSDEAAWAKSQDFKSVHMGRRILRAETAALAALSMAQCFWGDLC